MKMVGSGQSTSTAVTQAISVAHVDAARSVDVTKGDATVSGGHGVAVCIRVGLEFDGLPRCAYACGNPSGRSSRFKARRAKSSAPNFSAEDLFELHNVGVLDADLLVS